MSRFFRSQTLPLLKTSESRLKVRLWPTASQSIASTAFRRNPLKAFQCAACLTSLLAPSTADVSISVAVDVMEIWVDCYCCYCCCCWGWWGIRCLWCISSSDEPNDRKKQLHVVGCWCTVIFRLKATTSWLGFSFIAARNVIFSWLLIFWPGWHFEWPLFSSFSAYFSFASLGFQQGYLVKPHVIVNALK